MAVIRFPEITWIQSMKVLETIFLIIKFNLLNYFLFF